MRGEKGSVPKKNGCSGRGMLKQRMEELRSAKEKKRELVEEVERGSEEETEKTKKKK
jgi:hypothetical protein